MEITYSYEEGEEEEHRGLKEMEHREGGVQAYEHADEHPGNGSEFYRITTFIEFVDIPNHVNKYYLPSAHLDEFFLDYHQTGEEVIDIRPVTVEEAVEEWGEYDDDFR